MKKQKKIRFFIILAVICMISFFSFKKNQSRILNKNIFRGDLSTYTVNEIDIMSRKFTPVNQIIKENVTISEMKLLQGKCVQGIVCIENDLLVSDCENDTLYLIDYKGMLKKKIGRTGNAPGEFLYPTGITQNENNIFVLDAKNWRVQIFDREMNYENEIPIILPDETSKNGWYFTSIAVDGDGNIYIGSLDERFGHIICIKKENGMTVYLGDNFCGTVTGMGGNVCVLNIGLMTKNKNGEIGCRTAKNYLYNIDTLGLKLICELPYGITPTGFVLVDDGIYCVSGSYHSIDFYNFEGQYKYSIINMKEIDRISCITSNKKGNLYLSLPFSKKVYSLSGVTYG